MSKGKRVRMPVMALGAVIGLGSAVIFMPSAQADGMVDTDYSANDGHVTIGYNGIRSGIGQVAMANSYACLTGDGSINRGWDKRSKHPLGQQLHPGDL
ncbi:hypothetical protein [Streptomyces sp. NBC_00878]|uniref:hypothetical protein n=1 Tax=Streptomyces sp. NBC_00878 TaxID=2975854 RepID=UPI002258A994|nr:hypothetical protein [Streptomyces sp. NBC_00878]MCX4907513.1 hypothetical protein [Streptomyces sp. NBC_00878]